MPVFVDIEVSDARPLSPMTVWSALFAHSHVMPGPKRPDVPFFGDLIVIEEMPFSFCGVFPCLYSYVKTSRRVPRFDQLEARWFWLEWFC